MNICWDTQEWKTENASGERVRESTSGTETDQYIRAGAAEWRRSRILYAPVLFIWKWMQAGQYSDSHSNHIYSAR